MTPTEAALAVNAISNLITTAQTIKNHNEKADTTITSNDTYLREVTSHSERDTMIQWAYMILDIYAAKTQAEVHPEKP